MRHVFLFIVIFTGLNLFAGNYSIPQKLRGRYLCEVPSYDINHNGVITKVEALSALLLVYKTKLILRIGDRSFTANVERQIVSRNNPAYKADFPAPIKTCMVTFDRKKKIVIIDSKLFQDIPFDRIR